MEISCYYIFCLFSGKLNLGGKCDYIANVPFSSEGLDFEMLPLEVNTFVLDDNNDKLL